MAPQTAVAPEPAAVEEFPYKFEIIALSKMVVDEAYQRDLTSFVDKIVNKYDPALVGTLVVSQRHKGREYAVVDGQTRMEAMKELGIKEAPCLVYIGLDQGQEASLFARLQKERRGIHSFTRFRAALVAGEEEPHAIQEITNDAGYTVGIDKDQIGAVAALEYAYRKDPEVLERTLLIFKEAWGDEYLPTGDLIRGLAFLLFTENIDDQKMAERLRLNTPEQVRRRASAFKEGIGSGGGGAVRYTSQALHAVYRSKPKTT